MMRRFSKFWPLVALAIVASEWLVSAWSISKIPAHADWRAASAKIATFAPDQIEVHPAYHEPTARTYLGNAQTLGQFDRSLPKLSQRRVLVGDSRHFPEPSEYVQVETFRFGQLDLRTEKFVKRDGEQAQRHVVFDFVSRFDSADATRHFRHRPFPCRSSQAPRKNGGINEGAMPMTNGMMCDDGRWVGPTIIMDQGQKARRCVLALPPKAGEQRFSYSNVPSGTLHFGGGTRFINMPDVLPDDAQIDITIQAKGTSSVKKQFQIRGDESWKNIEMPILADINQVTITIRSDWPHLKDFCWSAAVMK